MPRHGICLRVTHTGLAQTSILIADVEDATDEKPDLVKSGPVYVPFEQTVEMVYSSAVARSFESGNIRKFIEIGHLTADFVFHTLPQQAAVGYVLVTTPTYTAETWDRFIFVCTIANPVTIQLPSVVDHATGVTQIIDARGTAGVNPITVLPAVGETVNGGASAVINTNFGFLDLRADCISDWFSLTSSGGVTNHAALLAFSLIWAASGHTGNPNTLAVFNGVGAAANISSTVNGDVTGTLPGPLAVGDLTIAGEVQGNVLYFNGANWVPLPPGVAGETLTTQGAGANPAWTSAGSAQLLWGDNSVGSTTTTRYLTPGYDDGLAETISAQVVAVRPGTLRSLRVRHNVPRGNGNAIVYTVRINGVATAISASIPSTSLNGSDAVSTVAVATGDRIDIEVTKAAGVGNSPNNITATVELV